LQLLKKYQLENGKLRIELSDVKRELATLTAAQPKKGRRGRKTAEEALTPEAQIAKYGAQFQVVHEPWVELDYFMKPRPDINAQDASAFGTTDADIANRIIRELYDFLPPALHVDMQTDIAFGKGVLLIQTSFIID